MWNNWYAWNGSGWNAESDPHGACSSVGADAGTPAGAGATADGGVGFSISIFPSVTAAGFTHTYLFDDFTTSDTIGTGTSGTNWFLSTSIGATLANAAANTTATAASMNGGNAGPFPSPNGGVLVMNGPNYPGSGNITNSQHTAIQPEVVHPAFWFLDARLFRNVREVRSHVSV